MHKNFISYYEKYMNLIGPIGNFMFFIQSYKIFTTKCANGISIEAFCLSFLGVASWLTYGILLKNKPLIISNIVGVVGAISVLVGASMHAA